MKRSRKEKEFGWEWNGHILNIEPEPHVCTLLWKPFILILMSPSSLSLSPPSTAHLFPFSGHLLFLSLSHTFQFPNPFPLAFLTHEITPSNSPIFNIHFPPPPPFLYIPKFSPSILIIIINFVFVNVVVGGGAMRVLVFHL